MPTPHDRLFKRADIYYYRRRVPVNLRLFFKTPVFVVSLKTSQISNAKRLANCYDLHFDFLKNKAIMDKIDPSQIHKLTMSRDASGELKVEVTPDDMRELIAFSPDQLAAIFNSFSNKTDVKAVELDAASPLQSAVSIKTHPTISELIELFLARKRSKKANFEAPENHLTFLRRLQEILKDINTIDEITSGHVDQVIDKLRGLPKYNKRYPNMTVDEILAVIKKDEKRLSEETINNHIELYAQLFNNYVKYHNRDYINHFAGMRQQADIKDRIKSNELRLSFVRDDLIKIFSSCRFSSLGYAKNYQYWTPLIALFTGARRAEIASLYKEDVYQDEHGIWVIDINLNHADKKLKTQNSLRKTPLHPWLLEHGFLDFVNSIHHERIFPELKTFNKDEGYGRNIGENFNQYIHEKLEINELKVFHSFRHTFASELMRQKVDEIIIEQLSGREDGNASTGRKYYYDSHDTPALFEEIKKLNFSEELKSARWKK
jgi:integrase